MSRAWKIITTTAAVPVPQLAELRAACELVVDANDCVEFERMAHALANAERTPETTRAVVKYLRLQKSPSASVRIWCSIYLRQPLWAARVHYWAGIYEVDAMQYEEPTWPALVSAVRSCLYFMGRNWHVAVVAGLNAGNREEKLKVRCLPPRS